MVRLSRHKTWFNPPAALIGSCPFPGGNPSFKPTLFYFTLCICGVLLLCTLYVCGCNLSVCLFVYLFYVPNFGKSVAWNCWVVSCTLSIFLSELACGYLRRWFTGNRFWGRQIQCSLGLFICLSFCFSCPAAYDFDPPH